MEYKFETLAERYQKLPEDLRRAMSSVDTIETIRSIAEDHGLLIDQTGALAELTSLVMLGLIPSRDFIPELTKRAEIDTKKATEIAKDINGHVFADIRESLRKIESVNELEDAESDIETAGDFSVEKNVPNESAATDGSTSTDDPALNKADILNSIENPDTHPNLPINIIPSVPGVAQQNQPATVRPVTPQPPAPAASLVNRMMSAPVSTTNETVEKIATPPTAPAPSRPGPDPYREPIE